MLIMLADAAEGLGEMKRAQECDEKARKIFLAKGLNKQFMDRVSCDRRDAIRLLAAGKPYEAALALSRAPEMYVERLQYVEINLTDLLLVRRIMAALKVLVDAMRQSGIPNLMAHSGLILVDVEETEAILSGYWEGVLEETRWALAEQRREAAAAAVAPVAAEREAAAVKKSKAAKRKQQKRKTQQQKKAAEKAEATAATAAHGDAIIEEGGVAEKQMQKEQGVKQEEEDKKQEVEQEGDDNQRGVTAAAAALEAMSVRGTKGGKDEEEQEEEDECSVCLNAIESDDVDTPAGPSLPCGHRYHAFCLHFGGERCTSKCIEPTCPYCRSPLQEVENI